MINIQELRYGSFVEYNGKHYQVCAIGSKIKIGTMTNYAIYVGAFDVDISEVNPIPLTEDILVKCGFEKSYSETAIYFNYGTSLLVSFPKDDNDFLVSYNGAFYDHIENVHQLMNLYFALTGKELEVNI